MSRRKKRVSPESEALEAGVRLLEPLMTGAGFKYRAGDAARSSGGRFANGFFQRDSTEIGLIVRSGGQLGVPNYSRGHGYASHDGVLAALGCAEQSRLDRPSHFTCVARDGGDPFEALFQDLKDLIIPVFERSKEEFYSAIDTAVQEFQDRLKGSAQGDGRR